MSSTPAAVQTPPGSSASDRERMESGLQALVKIARHFQIAADAAQLGHQLALSGRRAGGEDIVRGARMLDLKSRQIHDTSAKRLAELPLPALLELKDGSYAIMAPATVKGRVRLIDLMTGRRGK